MVTTADEIKLKMEESGANAAAVNTFLRAYNLLEKKSDFTIPEEGILPAVDIPEMESINAGSGDYAEILSRTVVIKLNGGLGTGMGMQTAKSLLEVKGGETFLDLIAKQNAFLEEEHDAEIKFLLMNSFSTSADTNAFLSKYAKYADVKEVEMMQNFSPKILMETLEPATCPENPANEWCPPGHGDIYTALYGSGWLDKLLAAGVKYAFVSNSDNLGALINPVLLEYFVKKDIPFLMEVTRRTTSDRKGGHLCVRKSDGQLLLREVAQCLDSDLEDFQNIEKHQFFNTNNLWLRLDIIKEIMDEQGGVMPLPIITNKKTLDPRDAASPEVFQLETAMGAAVDCFKGAAAICVPRRRFAPVKTTADLLALRSDAYEILENGRVRLILERNSVPPVVKLSKNFKFVDQMETLGVPSLKDAVSLTVEGNIKFLEGVKIMGNVSFLNATGDLWEISAGEYKDVVLTNE